MVSAISVGDDFISMTQTHINTFLTERLRSYDRLKLKIQRKIF